MTGQTLRDWVRRYNTEGLEELADHHRSGCPRALDEGKQATLKAMILRGPELERDGCVEWRIADLRRIAHERFGVAYAETGMLRLVKSLNLSWQKARPRHPKADRKRALKGAAQSADGGCR
jgi:transposase